MSPVKRKLLWAAWVVSFVLALAAIVIFVQGILRDTRAGEPVVHIDLASPSDWRSTPFRIWGQGKFRLFISSVNHDPQFLGAPLAGNFEVAIDDPDGKVFFQELYAAGSTDHSLPNNYGDSLLRTFEIDDSPWRQWTLKARVLKPDPRFRTAHTELKLWKERYDPGMGGLINYVMIIPAGIFLLIAFVTAAALAAGGPKTPLVLSVMLAVPLLAPFIG